MTTTSSLPWHAHASVGVAHAPSGGSDVKRALVPLCLFLPPQQPLGVGVLLGLRRLRRRLRLRAGSVGLTSSASRSSGNGLVDIAGFAESRGGIGRRLKAGGGATLVELTGYGGFAVA